MICKQRCSDRGAHGAVCGKNKGRCHAVEGRCHAVDDQHAVEQSIEEVQAGKYHQTMGTVHSWVRGFEKGQSACTLLTVHAPLAMSVLRG